MSQLNEDKLHLYLPNLTEQGFTSPSKSAIWGSENDRELLVKVSDSIEPTDYSGSRSINSIPDIWARPLLFSSTLFADEKAPGYKRIINEWKGLLSLLALKEIFGYNLSFDVLKISELTGFEALKTALTNLMPKAVNWDKSYDWGTVILVKMGEYTIGAFSPLTLVYTGTNIKDILARFTNIKTDSNGFLCPPTDPNDKQSLEALSFWIGSLSKRISKLSSGLSSTQSTSILNLLQSWNTEIAEVLQKDVNALTKEVAEKYAINDSPKYDSDLITITSEYPLYGLLIKPVEKIVSEQASVLNMVPQLETEESIYVITESLLSRRDEDWGQLGILKSTNLNPREIIEKYFTIYDSEEQKKKGDYNSSGTKFMGTDLVNAIWIRPEKFFLHDTLIGSNSSQGLLTDNAGTVSKRFLLPLKTKLLDYFDADSIFKKIKPRISDEGSIVTFSISLPLVNGIVPVEKTFNLTNQADYKSITTPMLELFPKYMGRDWRRYYLIYNQSDTLSFKPVAAKNRNSQIQSYITDNDIDVNGKIEKVRIHHFYTDPDTDINPYPDSIVLFNSKGKELGLILNKYEKSTKPASKKWVVGIDFGTSNTNVYVDKDTTSGSDDIGGKERLIIDIPSYFNTITAFDISSRRAILSQSFLPEEKLNMPIPTTVRIFDTTKTHHILADYFLYKLVGYNLPNNVYSDFKWEDTEKQRYFFASLLFMIFLEAHNQIDHTVLEIEFRFSYPRVFTGANKTSFVSNWKDAILKTSKYLLGNNRSMRIIQSSIKQKNDGNEEIAAMQDIDFSSVEGQNLMTEGEAAGLYARTAKVNMTNKPVILDIGGDTTDISIWDDYVVLMDCSVKLAGRQLSKLFRKNMKVSELLFSSESYKALKEHLSPANEAKFNVYLNYILSKEEVSILQKLGVNMARPEVVWLRKMIMLQFCAIAYYAGQALFKQLQSSDLGKPVYFFFGGNGAKFIKWIDSSKTAETGIVNKMMFYVLGSSLYGLDKSFIIQNITTKISDKPKCEASGGMIIPSKQDLRGFFRARQVRDEELAAKKAQAAFMGVDESANNMKSDFEIKMIHGDNIILKREVGDVGTFVESYQLLSDKVLAPKDKPNVDSLPLTRLKHFIAIYNKAAVDYGLITQDDQIELTQKIENDIIADVSNYCATLAYDDASLRLVEPIFIMEIRKLLDLLIKY